MAPALADFQGIKLWTGQQRINEEAGKGYTNFITTDEMITLRTLLDK